MAAEAVLVAHAHGLIAPPVPPALVGVLTVDGRILCEVDRFIAPIGIFSVVTNAGQGSTTSAIKATVNAWSNLTAVMETFVQLFENVFLLVCGDDAGTIVDPEDFWITVERYSRP